uniref:DJ-1/PfpI domain-containing protein n=1 Tax=Spongospora subterranea TaxID=70186 RepID=A0A0H5R546_9EUKA|eukprot:CRZ09268.1 hypothetical protein [Spongospora subterranea]
MFKIAAFAVPARSAAHIFRTRCADCAVQRLFTNMVKKHVLVAAADGSEDIELVGVVDVLRRADIEVTVASVNASTLTLAQQTKIVADDLIGNVIKKEFDCIVIPGGLKGAENLRDSPQLLSMLKQQQYEGKWIAAICAAPSLVLQSHGLLDGRVATCYPKFADTIPGYVAPEIGDNHDVVISKQVITSRSPGTCLQFGLAIVATVCGLSKANQVAEGMLVQFKKPSTNDFDFKD